tara:strand:- start:1482 stop:1826 length:345 start_codon:yes stop_codon:yes gene_type:complete
MSDRRPSTAEAIGALGAQMEAMNKRLDRDYTAREAADRDAAAHRLRVNERLIKLEQGRTIDGARLDRIEPVTAMVTSWRARTAGALMVLGLIGSLALGGVWYFKEGITRLIYGA